MAAMMPLRKARTIWLKNFPRFVEAAVFLAVMANLLWDEWMGMEKSLAGTGRIELPAFGFGDRCSACLSYAPIEKKKEKRQGIPA